jgi:hypothetical protein
MTLLLSRKYLPLFAGCDSGLIGFSVSNRQTRTSAAKRAAASGQWESISEFCKMGELAFNRDGNLGLFLILLLDEDADAICCVVIEY